MPFYRCAGTCILEMEGFIRVANALEPTIGKDYEVVVVSLDPRETPDSRPLRNANIFMTTIGRSGERAALPDRNSRIDPETGGWGRFPVLLRSALGSPVHSTGLMICTPQGKLSRYLLGVDYAPRRPESGPLVEAGENRIGSLSEKITLLCSQYDPRSGKYTVAVVRILQVAGWARLSFLRHTSVHAVHRAQSQIQSGRRSYFGDLP